MRLSKKRRQKKANHQMSERIENVLVDSAVYIMLIFLIIITLYPFLNILAISLNEPMDTLRGGIGLWPREFTLNNYKAILSEEQIYKAASNSVLRTVIGTAAGVFVSILAGYIMSRKEFVFQKPFSILVIMTMYFSGGIIPTFMLIRYLGLVNKFAVYILPNLLFAFNAIICRSYINQLPSELIESAKIDGAGELSIMFRIILPLALPIVATISLFIAVGQWSAWFDTFLYASSKEELSTLQYELMKKLSSALSISSSGTGIYSSGQTQTLTPKAVQTTMTIIATVPILIVYPFLQRYFVKGLTIGGIKG